MADSIMLATALEVTHSIVAAPQLHLTADDHQRIAQAGTDNVETL